MRAALTREIHTQIASHIVIEIREDYASRACGGIHTPAASRIHDGIRIEIASHPKYALRPPTAILCPERGNTNKVPR